MLGVVHQRFGNIFKATAMMCQAHIKIKIHAVFVAGIEQEPGLTMA
jgi:hypothetical protein